MNESTEGSSCMAATVPVLSMRSISKTFSHTKALSDVSLMAYGGEVHALMGENGAGKSTLMKVLSGAYRADPGGQIFINGNSVIINNPDTARELGIQVIYQELSLSPNITVAENIFLGNEPHTAGFIHRRRMEEQCTPTLKRLGMTFPASTLVSSLSISERQLVEIARAVFTRSRILIMDEPTTSLTQPETERLYAIIADLKQSGIAIIYISHRMNEIYTLADRVSVLRDGTYIGTLERQNLSASRLVSMMVGRDLSTFYTKQFHKTPPREAVLSCIGIADDRRIHDCSLEVHRGEVLAIAGLVGAGRTELARLICGADRRTRGRILLEGRELTIRTPHDAISVGIAYLTDDRKRLGLFSDMTVGDNVTISVIADDAHGGGFINRKAAQRRTGGAMRRFAIRAGTSSVTVGTLSGGNQQKVLLARLIESKPRILILDEPTRGVDVGAKSEIYRLIDELAVAGMAIIVISSELPEVVGIADRVLVMHGGRIVGEVHPPITQETIMALSTGAAFSSLSAAENPL